MNTYPVEYVFAQVPNTYSDVKSCVRDVLNCINVHPSLYPEVAQIKTSSNSASTERLVAIKGTIPIGYNNTVYHFPVEIALPAYYPHESPLFRLTPNALELKILPGHRHVDAEGKVYHTYLSNWVVGESNLAELVIQVSQEFSKHPPLYAPQARAVNHHQPPPAYSNTMPPPPPPIYRPSSSATAATFPAQVPPPPPPPPIYRAPPAPPPPPPLVASVSSSSLHGKLFRTRCVDKIKYRLEAVLPKSQREFQAELEASETLTKNSEALDRALSSAEAYERALEAQLLDLHQAQIATQERIAQQDRARRERSVEDLLSFPATDAMVSSTLLQSVADSLAMEDVLYQLNVMLQRKQIDLKLFLKLTRSFSREVFFKNALAIKLHKQQPEPVNGKNSGGYYPSSTTTTLEHRS